MSTITKPNTFTASTTIKSAQVNANFDTIYNDYNGNITNANIAAGAAIAASKLNLASPGAIGATTPNAGTFTNLTVNGAAIFTGDVYSVAVFNYGATSNILGFTGAFSTTDVYIKTIGNMVWVQYDITAQSGSAGTSFTVPYASNINYTAVYAAGASVDSDNAQKYPSKIYLAPGGTSVVLAIDMANNGFTDSGTKTVQGQFFYHR